MDVGYPILSFRGHDYRVLSVSPSQAYAVAQGTEYRPGALTSAHGFRACIDAPFELFALEQGAAVRHVGRAWCPLDALDGASLDDVIWYEENGFVKLCFWAFDSGEHAARRIRF